MVFGESTEENDELRSAEELTKVKHIITNILEILKKISP